MDETHRRYNAGKYPARAGGKGKASYEEGSKHGYYSKEDLDKKDAKKAADAAEGGSALKSVRKALGVTESGDRGEMGGLRTKKALEEN